jgi:hypothetical protein
MKIQVFLGVTPYRLVNFADLSKYRVAFTLRVKQSKSNSRLFSNIVFHEDEDTVPFRNVGVYRLTMRNILRDLHLLDGTFLTHGRDYP